MLRTVSPEIVVLPEFEFRTSFGTSILPLKPRMDFRCVMLNTEPDVLYSHNFDVIMTELARNNHMWSATLNAQCSFTLIIFRKQQEKTWARPFSHLEKIMQSDLYSSLLQICKGSYITGSSGGRVVKLLACGARGPGFDSRPRHLNFQRLVISCFQVEIWLKDR